MTTSIDVGALADQPLRFVPKLDGNERVEDVEVLQAHHERAVLKVTTTAGLVRFLKLDTNKPRHRHELAGLKTLEHRDMAPHVIFADPNRDGLAVLVVAKAHGRPLSAESSQADWTAVARALVETNSLNMSTLGAEADDSWSNHLAGLAHYADGSDLVVRAARTTMQSVVDQLSNLQPSPGGLGFIHGDAQPNHFFVDSWRVQAIDVADWTVGDIVFDIAVLSLDDQDRLDSLLSTFDVADRGPVRARVELYWTLRLATEIRWFDEHNFDPRPLLERLGSLTSNTRQAR